MTPAVEEAEVDNTSGYPTHRPFAIKINIKKIRKQTKRLRKPTNFAELFEDKVQRKVSEAKEKAESGQNDDGANEKGKDANENEVRREMLQELRKLMDAAIERGKARLHLAAHDRNTGLQWDLITAAVEQANIEFHGLKGKEAKKMRGRSKVEFMKEETGLTRELQEGEGEEELKTRAEWLRAMSHDHAEMGNKLINVARRMKSMAMNKHDKAKAEINQKYNEDTMQAYKRTAEARSKKKELTDKQKQQIKESWRKTSIKEKRRKAVSRNNALKRAKGTSMKFSSMP